MSELLSWPSSFPSPPHPLPISTALVYFWEDVFNSIPLTLLPGFSLCNDNLRCLGFAPAVLCCPVLKQPTLGLHCDSFSEDTAESCSSRGEMRRLWASPYRVFQNAYSDSWRGVGIVHS